MCKKRSYNDHNIETGYALWKKKTTNIRWNEMSGDISQHSRGEMRGETSKCKTEYIEFNTWT